MPQRDQLAGTADDLPINASVKDTYHMAAFLELDFSYEILGIAQEYGVDSYSTPQVMAFALNFLKPAF